MSMSFENKGINSFNSAYSPALILKRIVSYSLPWVSICMVELLACIVSGKYGLSEWIRQVIRGGFGPGSYYYPLLLQITVLFPIIYFVVKSHDFIGVVIFFCANVMYEAIATFYNMNQEFYRLCILRYLFCISVGCYSFIGKTVVRKYVDIFSMAVGFGYILLVNYTKYKPLIFTNWTTTSCMASLFVAPIIVKLIKFKFNKAHFRILQTIGRCSYEIFLTQMVYFWMVPSLLLKFGITLLAIFVINLVVCILAGIAFHHIEMPITRRILRVIDEIKYNSIKERLLKAVVIQDN